MHFLAHAHAFCVDECPMWFNEDGSVCEDCASYTDAAVFCSVGSHGAKHLSKDTALPQR